MENNNQHVQLPNNMTNKLTPQEILIYMSIKRYMNKDTKQAFPSLELIKKHSGASIPTIRKCISKLEQTHYIKIEKQGRKNIYTFLKWQEYEPISYEFLDKEDLTFTEKAYIAVSQQYMFKDQEGLGKISYTNRELSNKINMSESSICRVNASLTNKGYLTTIDNELRDLETGCKTNTKLFKLAKLGQAIIWKLKEHEDRISINEANIEKVLKENEDLKKLTKKLLDKVESLEKRQTEYIM